IHARAHARGDGPCRPLDSLPYDSLPDDEFRTVSFASPIKSRAQISAAELFSLEGKVALVTGASSGLGVRFAEVLADAGAAVALVARRSERLAAVKARIEQAGGRAAWAAAHAADRAAMAHAFDRAEAEFGVVDILVNNAGVVHADRAAELAEAEWRRVLGTNLDAALFWSQEMARRLIAANKGGTIVNIASILGFGVAKGVAA